MNRFWTIIELGWMTADHRSDGALRSRILSRQVRDVDAAMEPFFSALARVVARELTRDALESFVAEFDQLALELRTPEIARHMRARDLAYLGGRFRTVALGHRHYRAVRKNPRSVLVVTDADKTIAALWRLYDLRFEPLAAKRPGPVRAADRGVQLVRVSPAP